MGKRVNKRELAEIVGYTERALTDFQAESPALPMVTKGERGEENEYDTEEVIGWLVARAMKKAGGEESQRDRLTRLQAEDLEIDLRKKKGEIVTVEEIEPTWRERVFGAAGFIASSPSRIAQELEALPGIEAKRKWLKEEFVPSFLTRLGVDGARMQATVEAVQAFLIKLVSSGDPNSKEAQALLWRLAGDHDQPGAAEPAQPGVGAVRPGEEGSAV